MTEFVRSLLAGMSTTILTTNGGSMTKKITRKQLERISERIYQEAVFNNIFMNEFVEDAVPILEEELFDYMEVEDAGLPD